MTSGPPIRVLVICWGNSARSILAEALLRSHGGADFEVQSAGVEPKGINPMTERVLDEVGLDHGWARSKPVTEFLAESFDYVITVCDDAREACPVFPGDAKRLHWAYEDPAAVEGSDEERLAAFRSTLTMMGPRIASFVTSARGEAMARRAETDA